MNLSAFLNRGAAYAPNDARRLDDKVEAEAEKARAQWLNALLVDETRAWLSLGEYEAGVLSGLATVLTLAAFAADADTPGSINSPDARVIRGAISAATQCVKSGGKLTAVDAEAFSSAARRAKSILTTCSSAAIIRAATTLNEITGDL